MGNHACGFNQSETGKYFELIIISKFLNEAEYYEEFFIFYESRIQ